MADKRFDAEIVGWGQKVGDAVFERTELSRPAGTSPAARIEPGGTVLPLGGRLPIRDG